MAGLVPLCAVAAAAIAAPPPGGGNPAVTVAALDGSFSQTNSRDGMPVLTASEISPGDRVAGSVTIANSGTLGGTFSLSARDIVDTPGPGGGILSERLALAVRDVAGSALTYDGPLTGVDAIPLGYFAPGDTHTYEVATSLPHGAGDNAYAGAATSVRLVWDAVEAEPPGGTTPTVGDDTPSLRRQAPPAGVRTPSGRERPLRLQLRVPRIQRMRHGKLRVTTRCNRPCRVVVHSSVRVGSRRIAIRAWRTRRLRAGAIRPHIRLPRSLRPAARRALAERRPVVFRLTVGARDRAGRRIAVRRLLVLHAGRHGPGARVVTRPLAGVR